MSNLVFVLYENKPFSEHYFQVIILCCSIDYYEVSPKYTNMKVTNPSLKGQSRRRQPHMAIK